jgi:hypothetical protein
MNRLRIESDEGRSAFLKKSAQKTSGPAGGGTGRAFNRSRWGRLKALPAHAPAGPEVFLVTIFTKKVTSSS